MLKLLMNFIIFCHWTHVFIRFCSLRIFCLFYFSGYVTHDLPGQSYFVSGIEGKKLDLKCIVSFNLSQNDFRNTKHKNKNLQTKGDK